MPVRELHGPLKYFVVAMAVVGVVSAVGLAVDDRVLVGMPIWEKPLKFALSLGVYAATLAWMLSILDRSRRISWWAGTVVTAASSVEMALIVVQVVRGKRSHFNDETAFDAALYAVMGVTVAVLWLAGVVVAVLMFRQPLPDRATTWAIRFGSGIGVVGLALGFLMSQPTPEQLSGHVVGTVGAHSVGVPDGGPHLPLTGWAATGGDLRIAHFTGMHALQVLPLLALALTAAAGRHPDTRLADPAVRTRLVIVASAGYLGLVTLVTWQALRGQALVDPDPLTLTAASTLALAWLTGTLLALRLPPPHGKTPRSPTHPRDTEPVPAGPTARPGERASHLHDRVS
ncbi:MULTISPECIES: hypothetical protein [unclassified Streptomyces]|uniref:hypothetical protein n=1 Tax=unclassified Streptomyces TaxID=2593676 RepID=UPI0033B18111